MHLYVEPAQLSIEELKAYCRAALLGIFEHLCYALFKRREVLFMDEGGAVLLLYQCLGPNLAQLQQGKVGTPVEGVPFEVPLHDLEVGKLLDHGIPPLVGALFPS